MYTPLYAVNHAEITEVRDHYDDVYESIHESGGEIDWLHPMPEAQIQTYVEHKRLYAIRNAGNLAAAACLDLTPEVEDIPHTPGFLTISRLAAYKSSSPRGAGAVMLRSAEQWAFEQGFRLSVLYCATYNEKLRSYYEHQQYFAHEYAEYPEQLPQGLAHIPLHQATTLFTKILT